MVLRGQNDYHVSPEQKIFLFGCGPLLDACYEEICSFIGRTPDGVIDSSPEKIGAQFREFVCQNPTVLAEHTKPCVILTARKHWAMAAKVRELNDQADIFYVNYQMGFHKAVGLTNINANEARVEKLNLKTHFYGKRVLVTGATKGIGKAITLDLAEKGFDLVLVGRSFAELDALKNQLSTYAIRVTVISADLSQNQGLEKILNHPEVANQGVDLVYNNAAVSYPDRDFTAIRISYDDMLYAYALNVIAPIAISEHFLRLATVSRPVKIINVSSNADNPYNATYTLTKAALNKYTFDCFESYARQNAFLYLLDPSDIKTPMNPTGRNEVGAVFPGAWLPIYCKSPHRLSMLHANEFSGMSLEEAVARLIAKYPHQWQLETMN